MAEEKKLIKVPPLRKKGRSLVELGPDSLAAALRWNELAGELTEQAPADLPQATEQAPADPPQPARKVKPKGRVSL